MDVNIPRIYDGSIKGKYTFIGEKLLNGGQDEAQGLIVVTRAALRLARRKWCHQNWEWRIVSSVYNVLGRAVIEAKKSIKRLQPPE